jgi:hypothetical protein
MRHMNHLPNLVTWHSLIKAPPTVCVLLGRVVTMSFYEAMAAGLVDVPLILSSMQHEVNGWSGSLVFHLTNIEWASYLHAYFGSWPRGTVRYTYITQLDSILLASGKSEAANGITAY